MSVKTISQQTGWKRPNSACLCQDLKVLEKVTEFDYDLDDDVFVEYFENRNGNLITCKDSKFVNKRIVGIKRSPKEWRRWKRKHGPNIEPSTKRLMYLKAKLQDVYEIYSNKQGVII